MKNSLWSEPKQDFWGNHLDEAEDIHFKVFEPGGQVPENA